MHAFARPIEPVDFACQRMLHIAEIVGRILALVVDNDPWLLLTIY